jgi:hypothetical protein
MVEFAEQVKRIARMTQTPLPQPYVPQNCALGYCSLHLYNPACLINMMETFKNLLGYDTSGLSLWFHVRRWKRHTNQSPDLILPEGLYLQQ